MAAAIWQSCNSRPLSVRLLSSSTDDDDYYYCRLCFAGQRTGNKWNFKPFSGSCIQKLKESSLKLLVCWVVCRFMKHSFKKCVSLIYLVFKHQASFVVRKTLIEFEWWYLSHIDLQPSVIAELYIQRLVTYQFPRYERSYTFTFLCCLTFTGFKYILLGIFHMVGLQVM